MRENKQCVMWGVWCELQTPSDVGMVVSIESGANMPSRIALLQHTVKPVYNDHSRDQVMVVFVDRWSLYRGEVVLLKWPMEQPTVVSVDRWSFYIRKWSLR